MARARHAEPEAVALPVGLEALLASKEMVLVCGSGGVGKTTLAAALGLAAAAEQGLPGLDAGVHFMLYAPAATPKEVVSVLSGELDKIVGDPALKQRFALIGYDPTALAPDAAAAIMRKTGEVWAPVIKRLNIKLD